MSVWKGAPKFGHTKDTLLVIYATISPVPASGHVPGFHRKCSCPLISVKQDETFTGSVGNLKDKGSTIDLHC